MLETQQLTIEAFAYWSAISVSFELRSLTVYAPSPVGLTASPCSFETARKCGVCGAPKPKATCAIQPLLEMGWHRSNIFPQRKRQV